jgi:SAM-dependent methyltransferase
MIRFVCPSCKSDLEVGQEKYRCGGCGKEYPVRSDITCFNETDQYYGELSREEMQEFLRLAESRGWKEAVTQYLPTRNPGLMKTITESRRTAWVPLLGLKGDETALDFGCGLGGVSVPLSRLVHRVVALDGCFDRIRFLQICKAQDDLKNISLVCNGKAHELPFPDACFDLVILNMVFPYLAATLGNLSAPAAEKVILGEITRTLKPGGMLYLSIRNLYSFHWMKNKAFPFGREPGPDNFHSQGHGYYVDLLSWAGLKVEQSYWPLPNYKYPEHFVSMTDIGRGDRDIDGIPGFSTLKRGAVKMLRKMNALTWMAETICYIARKEGR